MNAYKKKLNNKFTRKNKRKKISFQELSIVLVALHHIYMLMVLDCMKYVKKNLCAGRWMYGMYGCHSN